MERTRREPWRGVNLGGWLLLEPGPSDALFSRHAGGAAEQPKCEWSLMRILREKGAVGDLTAHRETHITRHDFVKIKACGLNAVRLPLGSWVVLGPAAGEPFEGPALEYVDLAVGWAEELGLQVLLDLHGAPGGESGDAPSGRHQRPLGSWHWSDWRLCQSVQALRVLAERYRGRKAVTGIAVCNEPAPSVPLMKLCMFYDAAVDAVRDAGMLAEDVAVVLPAFQRPLEQVARAWDAISGGRHQNVVFDLHHYHCFGDPWRGLTLAQHLRAVEARADELSRFPAVVSEWSLALGPLAERSSSDMPGGAVGARGLFGAAQREVYNKASHGWFFWTWKDGNGREWDWQQSYEDGCLAEGDRPLARWPKHGGEGEDPLEEELDPSSVEPDVRFGDAVCLRSFQGTFLEAEASRVKARWADRGLWQRFTFCPAVERKAVTAAADATAAGEQHGALVRDGDVVHLRAHTGAFVDVAGDGAALGTSRLRRASTEFTVRLLRGGGGGLRHRGAVFLLSRTTQNAVDVDAVDGSVRARWSDLGDWQRLVVEKVPSEAKPAVGRSPELATPQRQRRRAPSLTPTPPSKRQCQITGEHGHFPDSDVRWGTCF